MSDFTPPVAFHFTVRFAGDQDVALACQEVSGLEMKADLDSVAEGGESCFVHQLPKPAKHSNLKLKRILTTSTSQIVTWCKSVLENDFSAPIQPKDMTVSLLGQDGDPLAQWLVSGAYPVKWSVGSFDAMQNQLAVESIELAYTQVTRTQ